MTFDFIDALQIGASAALVAVTYTMVFGKTLRERVLIGTSMMVWFGVAVTAGANAFFGLGTPGLGLLVMVPLGILTTMLFSTKGRARLDDAPLIPLVAVQAVRTLGLMFVLLWAAHRLPAPFAPLAGFGDMIVGLEALPLAWWLSRDRRGAHGAFVFWTLFGIADLVVALFLGATSAPGPIRLFFGDASTAAMTALPLVGVPGFLVPSLLFLHVAAWYKMRGAAPARLSTNAA